MILVLDNAVEHLSIVGRRCIDHCLIVGFRQGHSIRTLRLDNVQPVNRNAIVSKAVQIVHDWRENFTIVPDARKVDEDGSI